ncbi:MAG: hypothetical protein CMJ18_06045 [Phycisphaeraceae bacterium]|nr:hypothetical protein [Phycisphaeraceae bacterium]
MTCREEGIWDDLLSEKVKRHIPPGYLRQRIEVSDPLFARALVLDDGCEQVVLVTIDVTAIGARSISQNILADSADDFMPRLRRRVEDDLNMSGRCLSVCASHTHQVPRMLCDDEAQIERTVDAIRQARQSMVPVTVGVGSGSEDRLTCNRTMMLKNGSDQTIRAYHAPMPWNDEIECLRPVDPEIGVLRIDRADGRPLAVVYNFAAHLALGAPGGTIGTITADHTGVTLRFLEERIGDGIMAFGLQGALGDVQEVCIFDTQHPSDAQDFGTTLGQSILDAWAGIECGPATLGRSSRAIDLAFRTDIPQRIAALRSEQAGLLASLRYTSLNFEAFLPLFLSHSFDPDHPSSWTYRYMQAAGRGDIGFEAMDERNREAVDKYLESIRTMERMADNEENIATFVKHQEVIDEIGTSTVPTEFHAIRIGDGIFVMAPMELLSEVGLNVKRSSPFERTYVVSLCNGYLHYAPPASYYPRGGYEVTECLLAPEWEQAFERVVQELLDELRGGGTRDGHG